MSNEVDRLTVLLAAREAECAELRAALRMADAFIRKVTGVGASHTSAHETGVAVGAALSHPSDDYAALRAMLERAWEAGYLRGCGGCNPTDGPPWDEDDCRNRDVAVARLLERSDDPKGLPPATQAQGEIERGNG